jgi:hypothetical protein
MKHPVMSLKKKKRQNRKANQVLSGKAGVSGREEGTRKLYKRVNMLEILCTHV